MTQPPFGDEIAIMNIESRHTLGESIPAHVGALLAAIDRRDAAIADLTVSLDAERARTTEATARAEDAYRRLYSIAHGLQRDGVGSMAMAYDTAAGLVKGVLLALGAGVPEEAPDA